MSARRTAGELAEGLRIAGGALAGNRLRTFLTTLGILIGVTTVIAIVAVVQGLNRSFEAQLGQLGANTLYVSQFPFVHTGNDWWTFRNRKPLGLKELRAVEREAEHAIAAAPLTFAAGTVSRGGRELGSVQVHGTNASLPQTGGGGLRAGRFLVEGDVELSRAVTVLGADVADQLFPGFAPAAVVGERVQLGGRTFTVVGLAERKGSSFGMPQDNYVSTPYTLFGRLFGDQRSMLIAVAARPGEMAALEDELTALLRRVRGVRPDKGDDFSINRQEQIMRAYEQLTGALYGVAVGVGLITLVVGGIGIMNIMLVSVKERTREIGLRRALGARRRTILAQFLLEALAVSALGGALGTALGLCAAQVVAALSPLAAAVTPSAVALGLSFSAAVGVIFGIWPAWRAAHLDPVEALRYE